MPMVNLNCYIDESGDEGIECGGSRWFIVGALLVPETTDAKTSTMVARIKQRFGKDDKFVLHWSKVKKHDHKRYICDELLTEEWSYICVVTDKCHRFITLSSHLREKDALYFYSMRLLLERVSWFARRGGMKAVPIFEYRSCTSYEDMRGYFQLLKDWQPPDAVQISWNNIEANNFRILPKDQSRLLQASDCVCGAIKDALEVTRFGYVETSYVLRFYSRLYKQGGNLFSYGFKFLHLKNAELTEMLKQPEFQWLNELSKPQIEGAHNF